jgi:hypothetical protein
MAQIIDVRGSGGDLVLLGGALTLPTSNNAVATVIVGSIRFNITTASLEIYNGTAWVQATGTGSGVTSWNGRTGGVTLTSSDISNALGFTPLGSATRLLYAALPTSMALLPFIYTAPGLQPVGLQVWTIPVTIPFTLPLNCLGSIAISGSAARLNTTYVLAAIRGTTGMPIGTIAYAAGSKLGSFNTVAFTALVGDIITLITPSAQDTSLANVGIVVLGTRTT